MPCKHLRATRIDFLIGGFLARALRGGSEPTPAYLGPFGHGEPLAGTGHPEKRRPFSWASGNGLGPATPARR